MFDFMRWIYWRLRLRLKYMIDRRSNEHNDPYIYK